MNPKTRPTGPARAEDAPSQDGLDGASLQIKKKSPRIDGKAGNLERNMGKPVQLQKVKRVIFALLGVSIFADLIYYFVREEGPGLVGEGIPGFSAVYGLISTVLIIWVAKFVGHALLMKSEDYYD